MSKVKLYGKKDVRTAAYNRSASRFLLKLAESQEEGQFFSAQASLILSAFTHEAFLNTLGAKLIKGWAKHEYENPEDKLQTICKRISYKPNKGKRPYQTLKRLFRFRNLIAHGREEEIRIEGKIVKNKDKGGYLDAIEGSGESFARLLMRGMLMMILVQLLKIYAKEQILISLRVSRSAAQQAHCFA